MACNSLIAISKGCDNNLGGLVRVWVNDSDNITGTTVDAVNWEVTDFTNTVAFVEYEIKRNVSNYVETETIDLVNGSSFISNTLTLKFHRKDAAKARQLKIAGEGQRYLTIVVQDANGKYWWFEDMQLNGGTGGSGTAKADGSNFEVTFLGEYENFAYELDSAAVASLTSVNS